jgi:hypothetical protein
LINSKKVIEEVHWYFLLKALSKANQALGPSKKALKQQNDFLQIHQMI